MWFFSLSYFTHVSRLFLYFTHLYFRFVLAFCISLSYLISLYLFAFYFLIFSFFRFISFLSFPLFVGLLHFYFFMSLSVFILCLFLFWSLVFFVVYLVISSFPSCFFSSLLCLFLSVARPPSGLPASLYAVLFLQDVERVLRQLDPDRRGVLEYPEFCRGVFSILRTHRQHQKQEQEQRYGKPPYLVCKSGSASAFSSPTDSSTCITSLVPLHVLHSLLTSARGHKEQNLRQYFNCSWIP